MKQPDAERLRSRFVIAAPCSGSGKTTFTMGLLHALCERGMLVQPFKCGPDYIDTKFHERVCGRPSINLDTFMATADHVRGLFCRYGKDVDVCVVEGMMGLFDGYDRMRGSTADIAQVLQLPVVLVVDARSAAYSTAALLQGFVGFCADVRIAGVVFNKVGSARHRHMLKQVCEEIKVPCFGYLPKRPALEQGARYLGLDFSERTDGRELAAWVEEHVDIDALLKCTVAVGNTALPSENGKDGSDLTVAVARNEESFSFIYQETLDRWRNVTFFDPEQEVPELAQTDLLYLPGGYPEKHLEALAHNETARTAIRDYAERGGRIVAECGGMMYLCRSVKTDNGDYPMCGVLPYDITARAADRRLSLGYRRFELDGRVYRGHEFHYTQFADAVPKSTVQVFDAKGEPVNTPVLRYKNVLASYTHLYDLQPAPSSGEANMNFQSTGSNVNACIEERELERRSLRPVMLAGTGSDVGKSVLATALCRIFLQDGYRPAPFKAQNMALNSYATPDGLEIGRAQAVQAEACGLAPHTDMNPLLLKPNSDHTSQVVLMGRPVGNQSARSYFRAEGREPLRTAVCAAFDRLSAQYSPVVMEGAGSISEINLRDSDLVNLPMARHADAAVILVADIDRGGVFASCYGSIMLQTPEDRARIRGIIVNKFRGDLSLFDQGRKLLEEVCGVPVLGVVPYCTEFHIDAEDSVALERKQRGPAETSVKRVTVAVVLLPHISNFTDFDALERDPRVNLFYAEHPEDLEAADVIILPGTKSTMSDLIDLRQRGMAKAVLRAHDAGKTIMGICGGFQMLGRSIDDSKGIEGESRSLPGLGLLPVHTVMRPEKTTRQVSFMFNGKHCTGYEIHQGQSSADEPIVLHGNCIGTYIHGCLDNAAVIDFVLNDLHSQFADSESPEEYRQRQYDLLAAHVRKHVDMDRLYEILTS